MSDTFKTLKVSEELATSTAVADVATPGNGKNVRVTQFKGDAAFSKNSVVKIVWQYDHATLPEIIIWSTKGSVLLKMDDVITDADGVKKLALVCDNGETGDLILSGYMEYWEAD